jgi:hypothetical protein
MATPASLTGVIVAIYARIRNLVMPVESVRIGQRRLTRLKNSYGKQWASCCATHRSSSSNITSARSLAMERQRQEQQPLKRRSVGLERDGQRLIGAYQSGVTEIDDL